MGVLDINPCYAEVLAKLNHTTAESFLRLSGVIYSGHPDRHVMRLDLGSPANPLPVFLKREHCVRWRDRFVNGLQGFGLVSKSLREWQTLQQVRDAGLGVPEPIACGEGRAGAFLVLGDATGFVELRQYLQQPLSDAARVLLSRRLGEEIARLHAAGLCHGDLYSKHVLVRHSFSEACAPFVFLDWQRSLRSNALTWISCRGDLVSLLATLSDECFSAECRLAFLQAYCEFRSRAARNRLPGFARILEQVDHGARLLLRKRKIRELRQPALTAGEQNLVWLDGEKLCVTQQFLDEIRATPGRVWLPGGQQTSLTRRQERWLWRCCWSALKRKQPTSPELHQAATIFRLERFGVRVPRLLAVGQHFAALGRLSSFLLTAPLDGGMDLAAWLQQEGGNATHLRLRRRLIREAATLLRSIHEAECRLGPHAKLILTDETSAAIGVDTVAGMRPARQLRAADRAEDLRRLWHDFGRYCRRTEQLRFLLDCTGAKHLNAKLRHLLDTLLSPRRARQRPILAGGGRS